MQFKESAVEDEIFPLARRDLEFRTYAGPVHDRVRIQAGGVHRPAAAEIAAVGMHADDAILFDDAGFEYSEDETTGLFLTDLNLVLHVLEGPIVPFFTAGGGIIGTVDQTLFAYNFGGGVKIFLTKKIAVRVDYREYFGELDDDLEEVLGVGPGPVFYERPFSYKEDFHLREISIGLTFAF